MTDAAAATISLDRWVKMLASQMVSSADILANGSAGLATNPAFVLKSGECLFAAAAAVDILEEFLTESQEVHATLEATTDEAKPHVISGYFAAVKESLARRVLEGAMSPKRSTSQCANLIDQERVAYCAKLLNQLGAPGVNGLT